MAVKRGRGVTDGNDDVASSGNGCRGVRETRRRGEAHGLATRSGWASRSGAEFLVRVANGRHLSGRCARIRVPLGGGNRPFGRSHALSTTDEFVRPCVSGRRACYSRFPIRLVYGDPGGLALGTIDRHCAAVEGQGDARSGGKLRKRRRTGAKVRPSCRLLSRNSPPRKREPSSKPKVLK